MANWKEDSQIEDEFLQNVGREVTLIDENSVVGGTTSSKEGSVTLQGNTKFKLNCVLLFKIGNMILTWVYQSKVKGEVTWVSMVVPALTFPFLPGWRKDWSI